MATSHRFVMLFAAAPALAGLLQAPPQPVPNKVQERSASNEQLWTVRGCIQGGRLERSVDSPNDALSDLYPDAAFALKGNRELLARLKTDHAGHLEEVTGVVVIPRKQNDDALIGETKVGDKTRITVGTRERNSGEYVAPVEPQVLQMTVKSFTHIADRCVPRR